MPEQYDEILIAGAWLNNAVRRSEQILTREESLQYFRRGQELVKPVRFKHQQKVNGLERKPHSVVIQTLSDDVILRDLAVHAKFVKPARGGGLVPINPPDAIARHVRDRAKFGESDYRVLDVVTSSPCLLADGSILDMPGYRERVLFVPITEYPRVRENPTRDEAIAALAKFDELYHTFPFVGERDGQNWRETASYSALLASILSLLARPVLPTVPLTAIKAVTPGTGKTKLAESASIAALGYAPTSVSFHSDEEFSKALVPLLREADRAILIDNISIPLEGDMLCSVLTSEEHRARILGQSEQVRLLNRGVFFATGNNFAIKGDLTRRAVMVSLDANCERPEQREFSFDPVARARERHPELAVAALTAIRAYILAGKPRESKRPLLGSFENWDRLVCGCLMWLGFADPVRTRDQVIETDPQRSTFAMSVLNVSSPPAA